jgi:hypothetical protein
MDMQSPQVQAVLQLVGEVATAKELTPFNSNRLPGAGNAIARFDRTNGRTGPSSLRVELVGAKVTVLFREAPTWEFSSEGVELCNAFAKRLRAQFGGEAKVRIKRG